MDPVLVLLLLRKKLYYLVGRLPKPTTACILSYNCQETDSMSIISKKGYHILGRTHSKAYDYLDDSLCVELITMNSRKVYRRSNGKLCPSEQDRTSVQEALSYN